MALVVLVAMAPLLAADWPQFLGPQRNGASPETGISKSWPQGGPRVVWDREVGTGYSGPAVAGDRLILFHRIGDEEIVECLNPATGEVRWKHAYPTGYVDDFRFDDGPRATPLIADGQVFTLGAEGTLHCLDLATGKPVWSRALNKDYEVSKGFFGVGTSPLLEGDLLLINVGGAGAGVVALDRATGKEVWKATSQAASYSSPVAATMDGVRHAIFFTREGLLSLDPATGAVRFNKRWRARINASVNAAAPLVLGDRVFISTCYDVGALMVRPRKDGFDELWKSDDAMSNHYNTCVHRDGYLYGIDGRQEQGARLRCIDAASGAERWTREGFGCASLILVDGHLLALTEKGELVLAEAVPQQYREKARARILKETVRAHGALANGLFYGRDAKRFVCVDLRGKP